MFGIIKKILNLPLLRKSGLAAFDQGLLSGANFAVTVLLIKYLPKEDYGFYAIAFSVSLFLISIQNALVTTPLTVLLAEKSSEEKDKYIPALFWGQLYFLLPFVILSIIILYILSLQAENPKIYFIYIGLSIASIGILVKEYFKACLFVVEQEAKVISMDFVFIIAYIGSLFILNFTGIISVTWVIITLGITSLSASFAQINSIKKLSSLKDIMKSYHENWIYGKWALVGVTTTHIHTYGYIYILGLLLGSEAVAEINASRILLMPFLLLSSGWGRISRPYGAKLRESNQMSKYFKEILFISFIFCIGILFYTLILKLFSVPLSSLLFTDSYKDVFSYIFYWAAIFMVTFFRSNASFALQVIKKFSKLATINICTMIVTLVSAYFLIIKYAITGALISNLTGEIFFAVALWYALTRYLFGNTNPIHKKNLFAFLKKREV